MGNWGVLGIGKSVVMTRIEFGGSSKYNNGFTTFCQRKNDESSYFFEPILKGDINTFAGVAGLGV
ncbi:hypothetical protein GCM10023151_17260 [Kangiella marina]|uniref:Uncharacterized protein n=1 Tax=Kangiella marina TaxID=1079178 RepID=A0ABP8ILW3_9GAMM